MNSLSDAPKDGTDFLTFAWDCDALVIVRWREDKVVLSWDLQTEIREPEGYWPLPELPPEFV